MDEFEKQIKDEILKDVQISKYVDFMAEIKYRIKRLTPFCEEFYMSNKNIDEILLECICLQIRKILELIAMSCLVCNKQAFIDTKTEFQKLWKGKDIIKTVNKYNKHVFPIASYKFTLIDKNDKEWYQKLIPLNQGLLNTKLFEKIYDKCGYILHIKNPYSKKRIDLKYYCENIPKWIDCFLSTYGIHTVVPFGLKNVQYFIYFDAMETDTVYCNKLLLI